MLTDIFANRYAGVLLWENFEEKDSRFLVQAFRIISEQLHPYFDRNGHEIPQSKAKWKGLNDKLSMELGLDNLSDREFTYPNVCKKFVCGKYDRSIPADRFMKERLSFIEIAFRQREKELEATKTSIENKIVSLKRKQATSEIIGTRSVGAHSPAAEDSAWQEYLDGENQDFLSSVSELNTRIKQARYDLHYHNGFIQCSTDKLIADQIESSFWALLSAERWKNVDTDMKDAIDRRDNQDRDPALYAAKALESTIKIISNQKGWTHGHEKGAKNYLDNLGSRKNNFINDWEKKSLGEFFHNVRNPLGHGPGSGPMPELSPEQTDWAIEFCMIWIKALIRRL